MRYVMHRADGTTEPIDIHHVGLALAPGDTFEMMTASGGGYGDPLDRDPAAVRLDIIENRVDPDIVRDVYGVVLAADAASMPRRPKPRRTALRGTAGAGAAGNETRAGDRSTRAHPWCRSIRRRPAR
jgi:N-methylhydantoinase B/oxoprolinase/acetone carboxylase alpha subunit